MIYKNKKDQHYAYPTCSPSRAALMTGRNAEKLGLAHYVLNNCANKAPPGKYFSEHLKEQVKIYDYLAV